MGKIAVKNTGELKRELSDLLKAMGLDGDMFVAVIGASVLDRFLSAILGEFFIDSTTAQNALFHESTSWDLGTKATVAYCSGLISSSSYTNARLILEIRNIFAHTPEFITFEHEKVAAKCEKLDNTDGVKLDGIEPLYDPLEPRPSLARVAARKKFGEAVYNLAIRIAHHPTEKCKKLDHLSIAYMNKELEERLASMDEESS